MTSTRHYTLNAAARALRTHRPRLKQILELTGIVPVRIGKALVLDAEQFQLVRMAHRTTPQAPPGRPRKGRGDTGVGVGTGAGLSSE